jgi:hypothetical protein
MPGAGTKQQKTSELAQTIAATRDPQLTPDAVLNDFGQICIALPASGALIAVRELSGLRCTVSFGDAPAVGSRVPTDSALITQCFATGEFAVSEEVSEAAATDQENAASVPAIAESDLWNLPALQENVEGDAVAESDTSVGASLATSDTVVVPSSVETVATSIGDVAGEIAISPVVATSVSVRSAAAVPIDAQGSVVGVIEVFSSQPSALSPIAIAELLQVAKSFAVLMIHDAANGGEPIVGGPLDRPIILPKLAADQQLRESQATVNPASDPTDKPAQVESLETPTSVAAPESSPTAPTVEKPEPRKISKPSTTAPSTVSVTHTAVAPKTASLSQLPSDRPTPTRVWLIAAILLVALTLLALLLYKSASRAHDITSETTNRTAPLDPRTGALQTRFD